MNGNGPSVLELLYARLFKGVLLDSHISEREFSGQLLSSTIPSQSEPFLGEFGEYFSKDLQSRAEKMTYVYGLFYCFENLARTLVAQRLQERLGDNWWDSVPRKVQQRVEQRKNDVEQNKWHQAQIQTNIDFTLFGDLASIIVECWQDFEDLFPNQGWVKQRLDELERSRNVIAHMNILAEAEVERIEQYLGDWLRQVP